MDTGSIVYSSGSKGYGEAGASTRKRALKAFTSMSGSPREDIDYNNYTLRQRGRMLYMSAPIATSAIKTNRTNTIGMGLKLNPRIDRDILGMTAEEAENWEKRTKAEFALWANKKRNCDSTGINNFYEMQQLCFVSWLTSGDVLILKKDKEVKGCPYSLKLMVVEADRCSTPESDYTFGYNLTDGVNKKNNNRIYDGVEIDKDGAVVAYHIRNNHPYEIKAEPVQWKRVEAYGEKTGLPNVIHLMNAERPDQYRGVTYLAPVIEYLLQIRRYTESELTAALVESFFTAFVKTESGDASEMPFNEVGDGQMEDDSDNDNASYDPNEYELGPGTINVMNPGEDVVFADPKRPANGFDAFVKTIAKQIGAALEIPYDLLLKEFNASYSASRAALLEAWKSFKMYRNWFSTDFCQPVYELWMHEAVARGRITAPGFWNDPLIRDAWLKAEWIGPSQGQLDPIKEVNAEILAVANGFTTHEDAAVRLNGSDWNSNMEKLEREQMKIQSLKPKEPAPSPIKDDDNDNNDDKKKEEKEDEEE